MKRFTANYAYTNHNFVIQNLPEAQTNNNENIQILYILKNILQRGYPTLMSQYLQSSLTAIHKLENFNERFLLIDTTPPCWRNTIKGSDSTGDNPAKKFFEHTIPAEFGDYAFIQPLLMPEVKINTITGNNDQHFVHQEVDFYLPQAKLVIEIDGGQHKLKSASDQDTIRDSHLQKHGINVIRITTQELREQSHAPKIQQIIAHLTIYEKRLRHYRNAFYKIKNNEISELEQQTKLLPSAIMRFQLLLLELLINGKINFDKKFSFNILCDSQLPNQFAELAIKDLWHWLNQLYLLKNKTQLPPPKYNIQIQSTKNEFRHSETAINVDFSLLKRYTDEHLIAPHIIYIRTDYFDDINYFQVSTTKSINYQITNEDIPVLEFFLLNIFEKNNFRDGQFHIVANALNQKDTIGLLPTGGGKSLCYQLPCLLQPAANFVVCPIKSLMYDQKDNLSKIFISNVAFITSDLAQPTRRQTEYNFANGKYLIVWISPEKFQIPAFRDNISSLVAEKSIAYAVIDEVHCLSEWGHDFRTSYLNLVKTIDNLSSKDSNGEGTIKFIGLTATASVNVLKDIKIEFSKQKSKFADDNVKSLLDFSRKELNFTVIDDKGQKFKRLQQILDDLTKNNHFLGTPNECGLIFTPFVNGADGCYDVANKLETLYPNKVGWFSGSKPKKLNLSESEFNKLKLEAQEKFKNDKLQLLVATKAFGMGIDKQNVFYTVHYGISSSVEALYQEAGRAGRWDKSRPENHDKIGNCMILHTPVPKHQMQSKIFEKATSFKEIQGVLEQSGTSKYDLNWQLSLFSFKRSDVEEEASLIFKIIKKYFKPRTTVQIKWLHVEQALGADKAQLEKAIYRLTVLGVASDWTTDFISYFEVTFDSDDDQHILNSLARYITKYDPNIDVDAQIITQPQNSFLEKAIWFLLSWVFENITYGRKQSLKTLSEWCAEYEDSQSFKKRIDSYFIFTNKTTILQHIAEKPNDYPKWFDLLYSDNHFLSAEDFTSFKDSISRFLESFRNNIGLDFLSGFTRLALDEYDNSDGKNRLEHALSFVKNSNKFSTNEQSDFLDRLQLAGAHLSSHQQELLAKSVSKYFPFMLRRLAESYNLAHLLVEEYQAQINKLKKINYYLYEQLTKI